LRQGEGRLIVDEQRQLGKLIHGAGGTLPVIRAHLSGEQRRVADPPSAGYAAVSDLGLAHFHAQKQRRQAIRRGRRGQRLREGRLAD
jgi:hypothetical protein